MNKTLKWTSLGSLAALGYLGLASGSSHREAPLITEMPKVDATDFYMFNSYEKGRQDYVTLVANYLPLQDAYGGPNYFTLDPNARYEIKIDNDGDALEDITFSFRFVNRIRDIQLPVGDPGSEKLVSVPLRNVGPFGVGNEGNINEGEWYALDVTVDGRTSQVLNAATGANTFSKPLDNIGNKSIPDYESYAASKTYGIQLPGNLQGRMFVGQRKDPFVVNLGATFDLVNLNPLGPVDGGIDDLADANVTALILEIPTAFLTSANQPILGGWTTASLPRGQLLTMTPSYQVPTLNQGHLIQVSRLGMPLVNEVVIGLKDKNLFNASHPAGDAQFADYITNPTLPELLEALFGVTAPNQFPRTDLVDVFAEGVPGLNENGSFGEMLRLNTSIAPTPSAMQSELGVLGGDLAGFPNGRRPGDDVVDLALRVVMGALLPAATAPDGQLPYTDGALVNASFFDDTFPYLRTPLAGATQ